MDKIRVLLIDDEPGFTRMLKLNLERRGFEVRVELTLTDGDDFSVQLTRDEVDQLELVEGQIVFVRPRSTRVFAPDGRGSRLTSETEVS